MPDGEWNQNHSRTSLKAGLTGLPVLLVLPVKSVHSFQQLPLLTAAGVVDEVPGEDLLELADREVLYRLLVVQIWQRGSDPPLCRRTDLQTPPQGTRRILHWSRIRDPLANHQHWPHFFFLPLGYFQLAPGSGETPLKCPPAPVWEEVAQKFIRVHFLWQPFSHLFPGLIMKYSDLQSKWWNVTLNIKRESREGSAWSETTARCSPAICKVPRDLVL